VGLPLCAAIAVAGLVWPESIARAAAALTGAAFSSLDWFFMASVTAFLVFALWLAFSRYGRLKLGKPGDEPEFSTSSWLAMLFAAGMGVGLLFWGVAEPMSHYSAPPTADPATAEAARQAMVITNFHWGLHAWAIYCVGGLVLAYFGFRRGTPYLAGAPIREAFKGRWVEPVARASDLLAVLAVAFGVAGSITFGVFQFRAGLHVVTGIPADSTGVALGLLGLLFVSYMTSAATSLDKGIRILSNVNMSLAIALLVFVLLAGPTAFLLRCFVTALGDYATSLPSLTLRLYPYQDLGSWVSSWTLTYFIWWIAWAPFVGIFIARISKGRTIREFVLGVIFAPSLFSVLWFAIFGGLGIWEETHGAGGIARMVNEDVTAALFALFDRLPLSSILSGVAVLLIFIFVVTSVDSATFVLAMLTSEGSTNPPTRRKLAWGISLAVLAAALLLAGNHEVVRAITVTGAIPFVLVLLLQVGALIRALRQEER